MASSQFEFVEESAVEDFLGAVSILGSNQVENVHGAKTPGINDIEHTPVLWLLTVLTINEERYGTCSERFAEVTQVHERTFREQGEICVTKPHKELVAQLIE